MLAADFVIWSFSRAELSVLSTQVMHCVAKGIEGLFGQSGQAKRKRGGGTSSMSFTWTSSDVDGLTSREVAPMVAQYWVNSNAVFSPGVMKNYSISTDKAQVSGLPLQNSIIVLGEVNFAFFTCPSVAFVPDLFSTAKQTSSSPSASSQSMCVALIGCLSCCLVYS